MTCNCWDGNHPEREGHIPVLCPRCQVTDFLNLIFGHPELRDILRSKIQQSRRPASGSSGGSGTTLKLVSSQRHTRERVEQDGSEI